jgi:cobalt-zinc-cadmium efflux system protein
MSHGHSHGASGGTARRRRLAIVLALSSIVLVVEIVGAIITGSLALFADAGHMLTDVGGLALAVWATALVDRPASTRRTFGLKRAEVLAAAAQAAILLAVGVFVVVEGIRRLVNPPEISGGSLLVFGMIGLVANLIGLAILRGSQAETFNTRAAFLEVANDALGSLAVIVAALVIALTGWERADAVASLAIGVLIIPRTLVLLKESIDVLLESTPKELDLDQVRAHILELPHVTGVHDLHASQLASDLPVLSAHVVVEESCFHDGHLTSMLDSLQSCLAGHFDVEHSTFQFEPAHHAEHEAGAHL